MWLRFGSNDWFQHSSHVSGLRIAELALKVCSTISTNSSAGQWVNFLVIGGDPSLSDLWRRLSSALVSKQSSLNRAVSGPKLNTGRHGHRILRTLVPHLGYLETDIYHLGYLDWCTGANYIIRRRDLFSSGNGHCSSFRAACSIARSLFSTVFARSGVENWTVP